MRHTSAKEEDESWGSNIDSGQGTKHLAVKTEERDEPIAPKRSFWLGKGTGSDPRIHMVYRETDLSEGSSDSSSDSSSDVLEELARDFPEIAAEIEQMKVAEKRRVEKLLRKRKPPGPIFFRMVRNRGQGASKRKKRGFENQERDKTENDVKKEEV